MQRYSRWNRVFGLLAVAALLVMPVAAQNGTVKVMTYNVNEGSDFLEVLSAQTPAEFVAAVQITLNAVDASNPPLRMQAVAHQIAINQPDLVGLQEVSTWLVGPPSNPVVRYDMLQELVAALAAQGQKYKVVGIVPEFQLAGPLPDLTNYVFLQDTDVMLARDEPGMGIANVQWGIFPTLLPVSTPGGSFNVTRGWGSADVTLHGQPFRFIVTHLESYVAQAPATLLIQEAQAYELATGPANTNMPVVIAGDFNADALGKDASIATWHEMMNLGFTDAWWTRYPNAAAAPTWPLLDSSANNATAFQRIDYIWTKGNVRPLNLSQAGAAHQDKTGGLWPSDHAGVRAHLQFGHN
ncbi:endonuclease/exonuclease/phosphatase family protein [Occallatibacter riparius]|uniref:Endonuclease/exonuclease/phosphatase family protein n=1 Tax=Occallatibacter riparius TaxID=1002689 RepID=A0A9J7BLT7_9BACT|nr:endonuclease/exonuclease/phosphatase family protein [Occallatibacter riparius]UWZ81862.1 endonuclease/exonuclease/phosphatase family protein [Occallatibacter riparius]